MNTVQYTYRARGGYSEGGMGGRLA